MITTLTGDCREVLRTLPANSVHAVITSPPYYGLRSYIDQSDPLKPFEIGLEPTPEMFVQHMVEVFREVWRVLRDDGTLWLNLGDSYAGSGKGPTGHNGIGDQERRQGFGGSPNSGFYVSHAPAGQRDVRGYKAKDLMEIPSMVAQALRADGWYLRSRIPWLKRNAMPESQRSRPSTAVEYVFLLNKTSKPYWDADAVRVNGAEPDRIRRSERIGGANGHVVRHGEQGVVNGVFSQRSRRNSDWFFESWQGLLLDEGEEPLALIVNPTGFKESHFATFPVKLVEPLIKASTSEKGVCAECGAPWRRDVSRTQMVIDRSSRTHEMGRTRSSGTMVPAPSSTTLGWQPTCSHAGDPVPAICLDPFGGAGTVGLVADRLGRNSILIDLKPDYVEMQERRLMNDAPLFLELESNSPTTTSVITDGVVSHAEHTPRNDGNRWNRNNGRGF